MPIAIPVARQKLINAIAAAARPFRRTGDPAPAAAFIRLYYHGVAEEDLAEYNAAELAAAALTHLRFARTRKPRQALVRVYNEDDARLTESRHSIVEVVIDDMPFLVDSLSMVLTQSGYTVHLMVHPVLAVMRDAAGRLRDVDAPDDVKDGARRESWQQIRIDRIDDEAQRRELERRIASTLSDVKAAVADWGAMRAQAERITQDIAAHPGPMGAAEAREITALLEWMLDNHFTFLGYREYRLQRGRHEDVLEAIPQTGLGILRPRRDRTMQPTRIAGDLREHARDAEPLTITKANSISTVHRTAYLDYIGLKTFDARGRVTGERRFLGLFTSSAYHLSPREIPLLRQKIERVIAHFSLDPASHDAKAVVHVLETYPRDELFQARVSDLVRIVRGVVNLYERQRVRVFLRRDAFGRFYSALIYVPRDRYNTQVREKMEAAVRAHLQATSIDSQVQLSESALARVHMIIRAPHHAALHVAPDTLEALIAEAVRTWDDRLRAALIAAHGECEGRAIATRFSKAFSAAYQEDAKAETALADIQQLDEVLAQPDRLTMRLVAGAGSATHLRLSRSTAPVPLSQALPIIENMGFVVVSERPYRIQAPGRREIWLQDFEMQRRDGARIDPQALSERFTAAFVAVWNGQAENDGFNRLVVMTEMDWRQASVIRAYGRYLLQTSATFSQSYMEQVLASNARIASVLWELFAAQFDPTSKPPQRKAEVRRREKELARLLERVTSLDEDRILRRFAAVMQATLRTNYFQRDEQGAAKPSIAFKLDARNIPDLPQPRPAFEIFIYSPRVEGVHLRMGPVARGGIRWSDRREDFRTEVLGLMKAQNVKNTLIVPVGAKGGFVPKRLPANATREDLQREGIECYRTFIRGLLDVTDNIVKGRIVGPENVVRRDGDDAYLVVAADKGTATFSDVANEIAAEYNFWLGDAFASGGSAGYDHKKMGITARGAWECVRRHFRELGVDTQAQDFTAIGIGDMAGDVFGNGMLCSPHIRLLGAFNHQHIFIDPNPDAAASFRERERLFQLPRSTWEDYDARLISRGGGVFSRAAKSIRLSREAQAMLGVNRDAMTPPELIRALLCMPVDLLWNGGIGTYVKATSESHHEIGDRANDALRVNGAELRCKVVGEGGNLGFSQRGRIEYALQGGRLNTDFVDNSGGVDCSDHEVNIKILLNNLPPRAALTLPRRNKLLAAMTQDVARLVLRDNYLQSQALSMLEARADKDIFEHAHAIRSLELSGVLNRQLEFLPSMEEIDERHKAARGLTRPELAIMLAYAKMALFQRLIESDVPEDPYLGHEMERYFPSAIEQRFGRYLSQHRLRREIIATATTNSMINRMGPTFARRVQDDTGANAATVVRAYAIAREAFDMRATWSQIEALDNRIEAATQYEMMFDTSRLLQFCTYWLIHRHAGALEIEQQVSRLRDGLESLAETLPQALSGAEQEAWQRVRARYLEANAPDALSERMASFSALRAGPDLVEIAAHTRLPLLRTAQIYFELGAALSLDWLREQTEALEADGHWQAVARTTLRDNIYALQRSLCLQALAESGKREDAVELWTRRHQREVDYVRQTITDMHALPTMDFATLSVALQAVRRMTQS